MWGYVGASIGVDKARVLSFNSQSHENENGTWNGSWVGMGDSLGTVRWGPKGLEQGLGARENINT